MCTAEVSVSHGVGAVKRYKKTPKHAAMVKAQSTQSSFVVGNGIILYILNTGDRVPIILEEKKWNAEILHAVNVVTCLIHALMVISRIDKCFLTLT